MFSTCNHWFQAPSPPVIVGRQGQMLEAATSCDRARGDEVVKGKGIKRLKCAPWPLHSLINGFSQRIGRVGIVAGGMSVLDVVLCLELLETLHPGVIDILSVRDEGRRRSTWSRHFDVEDGIVV